MLSSRKAVLAVIPRRRAISVRSDGAVLTTGWDHVVAQTRAEARSVKQSINGEWVYPPVDATTILDHADHADHRTTWPTATVGKSS